MTARAYPTRKVAKPDALARVELPKSIAVKLTRSQMKAFAPLFAAAQADCDASFGDNRGAIYAQPFQYGILKAGYLAPHEANKANALLRRLVAARAAVLASSGRRKGRK